ncbi:sulfatase-like hydrolase/transferase [Ramlibacter sp. AW1]|uniref:Sulfatase-like hydrolase/transferase n=1 Tax=Ramlibacter aurantiacus TaxID=2801330 RepID=A0A936ZYQ0_9BURK|nr:sulfatase-like hydrolase/transferase [Ramlibacter aurantiacus]MBL0422909.1 sulfatase-like hydrolase/transferase [Ramlibacter aurantiacus]
MDDRRAPFRQVVLICSDEHDPRHSGFGGSTLVKTPHLDRLAAQGAQFTRCWTPSPLCVPARASLATGLWVHQHRCWDNAIAYDGGLPSWGHRLRAAGIRVESIGKLHYRDAQADTGFDRQHEPMHLAEGKGQVWGSVRDPLPEVGGGAPLFKRMGAGESDYNRFDRRVAQKAADWIAARGREGDAAPAALFVGLVAPHFPLVVPQPYLDLYPPDSLPMPKLRPQDGYTRHPWVERLANYNRLDEQLGSDAQRRLAMACYFGLVSFMDEQVGRVLRAIDESGMAEDTLVLYFSDHGDNLGARGLWNKSVLYRESTAVPMLLRGRGIAARAVQTPASLVDVFPTVLQALGVEPPAELPGRSLLDQLERPDPHRCVLSEYHAIGSPTGAFMLAAGDWKLHEYVGYPPELFDLANDPQELHDLAASPAHAGVLRELQAVLRERLDPLRVDRLAKDDQNRLVQASGGREAALAIGRIGATPAPRG